MLVFGMRDEDSVSIFIPNKQGGEDEITFKTFISDNQLKVGIDAPRHIPIYRKKVLDKIRERFGANVRLTDFDRLKVK